MLGAFIQNVSAVGIGFPRMLDLDPGIVNIDATRKPSGSQNQTTDKAYPSQKSKRIWDSNHSFSLSGVGMVFPELVGVGVAVGEGVGKGVTVGIGVG